MSINIHESSRLGLNICEIFPKGLKDEIFYLRIIYNEVEYNIESKINYKSLEKFLSDVIKEEEIEEWIIKIDKNVKGQTKKLLRYLTKEQHYLIASYGQEVSDFLDDHLEDDIDLGNIVIQQYYENGKSRTIETYLDGCLNSIEDLPAKVSYFQNGNKAYEEWYQGGEIYRENDLPTEIHYYENGNVEQKYWRVNGKLHREGDLPAAINYYEDGTMQEERWYKEHKLLKSKNY